MDSDLFSMSLFKMVTSLANSFLQKKSLMVWFNNVPIFRELSCADPEWDGGGGAGAPAPPPPPEKSQTYTASFLAILVQIPRKITKLLSQHSMLGHHWRFAGGPMMTRF